MKFWRVMLVMVLTVLLPLRSALAVTMGLPEAARPAQTQPAQDIGPVAVHDDPPCPHHAAHAKASSPDTSHAAPAPHDAQAAESHPGPHAGHPGQAHLLCDVCNGPALSPRPLILGQGHASPLGVPPRIERFASVVLPIGHKPPIPA